MPTYDYQCQACGHAFEEFQSMSAKHLKKCPKCGKNKLVRLIGIGAGVIFKGSGFYETDYRSDSYKNAAKADQEKGSASSEAKDTTGTPETKSDSKTDQKSDSKTDAASPKAEAKPDSSKPAKASPATGGTAGSDKSGKPAGSNSQTTKKPAKSK